LLELQRELDRPLLRPVEARPLEEESIEGLQNLVALSADDNEATAGIDLETRVDLKAHRDEADTLQEHDGPSELERVTLALGRLGRLPPQDPDLNLAILLSIESMYAELGHTSDDHHRYTIVRDAFPNLTHLRVALTALIRLLDEGRRTTETVLREADSDILIRTLLFEERRLDEASASLSNGEAGHLLQSPLGQFS